LECCNLHKIKDKKFTAPVTIGEAEEVPEN
jgi:hypothetical protein